MTTQSVSELVPRLVDELTDETAPMMGVHTMSEFMYCPRAGIITVDQSCEDTGSEFIPAPALGGIPMHDLDRLQRLFTQARKVAKLRSALMIVTMFGIEAAARFFGGIGYTGLLLVWLQFGSLNAAWQQLLALKRRLQVAERAAIAEPDWENRVPQPIRWWSLIRAGWESVERQSPIADRDLRLAGKPWRIMQRGNCHLPVVRIAANDSNVEARRNGILSPQQRARLAAYCYLISRVEGAQSDWAIVLFANSDDGIAIPIDETIINVFAEGLMAARRQLSAYQSNTSSTPNVPRDAAPCRRCPLGKPHVVANHNGGSPFAPYVTQGKNLKRYHSDCGDRFCWVPPHEEARTLGLIGG